MRLAGQRSSLRAIRVMRRSGMLKKIGGWFFIATCLFPAAAAGSPASRLRHAPRVTRVVPRAQSNAGVLPGQSQTLMPDDRVLLLGGEGANGPANTVSLQDPANGSVTTLAVTLLHARAWHSATLLPDGTVLILGGKGTDGVGIADTHHNAHGEVFERDGRFGNEWGAGGLDGFGDPDGVDDDVMSFGGGG